MSFDTTIIHKNVYLYMNTNVSHRFTYIMQYTVNTEAPLICQLILNMFLLLTLNNAGKDNIWFQNFYESYSNLRFLIDDSINRLP